MAATQWQPHLVGAFSSVVRKKLGLNLVSETTDKGRVYRTKDANGAFRDLEGPAGGVDQYRP
jgi:Protein of unknown function (DUF3489)